MKGKTMEQWFKTLSIKELSTWIKNFDNSTLSEFLNRNHKPNREDIKKAKKILIRLKKYFCNYGTKIPPY